MSITRSIAGTILRALPDNGLAVKNSVRGALVRKDLALSKLAAIVPGATLPDPRTVFWISTQNIRYRTSLRNESSDAESWVFPQGRGMQLVRGGDWDQSTLLVSDLRACKAVEERIRHGTPWENSDYYRAAVREIECGQILWRCSTRADFDKRMVELDRLIESIAADGSSECSEACSKLRADSPFGESEILVNVSRDGRPLFQDGRHRLAIARALNLPSIPVQVLVRHTEWQQFREFMIRMARGSGGASKRGFLYQKPHHFDFVDVPAEHGCSNRADAIRPHLARSKGGDALDIGCNLGYFSHELAMAGLDVVAVEYLPEIAFAAHRLAAAEERSFRVVHGDMLAPETLGRIGKTKFSVILAVNIFHHFIKTEEDFHRLRALVSKLRADLMFFEPHHPEDPQMKSGFANPTPDEFAKMIVEWGGFARYEPIYTANDGRTIYKLT